MFLIWGIKKFFKKGFSSILSVYIHIYVYIPTYLQHFGTSLGPIQLSSLAPIYVVSDGFRLEIFLIQDIPHFEF
jgi:hypothetical protein